MKTELIHTPVNIEARKDIQISTGDTVRVSLKIEEKGKTRIQKFEGVIIATKHGNEPGGTFTVRRSEGGYGVERIFPLFSPTIDKIEVVKRTRVKRSKLYFIRDKASKEIRRQMRKTRLVSEGTVSEQEETKRIEDEGVKEAMRKEAEAKEHAEEAAQKVEAESTATDVVEEVSPEKDGGEEKVNEEAK